MGRLYKKLKVKESKKRAIYKLTIVFFIISLLLSIIFLNIVEKTSNAVAFSDNILLASIISFTAYILVNWIKNVSGFKKEKNSKDKIDEKAIDEKFEEGQELLGVISNSFLINGIICLIISLIVAFIIIRW